MDPITFWKFHDHRLKRFQDINLISMKFRAKDSQLWSWVTCSSVLSSVGVTCCDDWCGFLAIWSNLEYCNPFHRVCRPQKHRTTWFCRRNPMKSKHRAVYATWCSYTQCKGGVTWPHVPASACTQSSNQLLKADSLVKKNHVCNRSRGLKPTQFMPGQN